METKPISPSAYTKTGASVGAATLPSKKSEWIRGFSANVNHF